MKMTIRKVPMPEKWPKVNWDKVFERIFGFSEWQDKWNKIREAQVKKNYGK